MRVLLCGHAPNAKQDMGNGVVRDVCVICTGDGSDKWYTFAPEIDLRGRRAKCHCGKIANSEDDLAFFEYMGPGSKNSMDSCVCGYYLVAHEKARIACKGFRPIGIKEFDTYYCGCNGWD